MRSTSINFDCPQQYVEKVVGRMETKDKKGKKE